MASTAQTTTTANGKAETTTNMAKKQQGAAARPQMAAKKEWSFDIKHDQEIPIPQRNSGRRLPFEYDKMKVGSMFEVPVAFWTEFVGLTEEQATNPARNKEAIRRNFYAWRDQDAKREKLALAFSDQYDPKSKEYTGVRVYMANAPAKPKAA